MKQYGILAYPAKHSLSPVMHNAAFKALGIDAQYGIFEIPENGLDEFMEQVKHEPISGLSVSLPYKEVVMRYLDKIDENAEKIGAVNTVVNKGGFLYGYNTDFIGSNMALKEATGGLKRKRAVVVGAGGATKAVVYGLLKEGAEVRIFNRTKEKAQAIAHHFSEIFGVNIENGGLEEMKKGVGGASPRSEADILIQTTSIWTLDPNISEAETRNFIPPEYVKRFDVVMDIVYKPLITPLLKIAKAIGKKIITGDKMLLYQGAEAFKLWTGKEAPIEELKKTLQRALEISLVVS